MPRTARIVIPGLPHHITQRGNNKELVFREDADYNKYLAILERYSSRLGLAVAAYCLMSNHVHFVAVPALRVTLAEVFRNTQTCYTQYFNSKYNRTGHLWQCRFYSCAMDEAHTYSAVRYVENNPARAGLVKKAGEFKWSSARAHLVGENSTILDPNLKVVEVDDWAAYLRDDEGDIRVNALRKRTRAGMPVGEADFIEKLERQMGIPMTARRRGRPSCQIK